MDIGRCTCVIVKETSPDGFNGGTLYSLYTYVRPFFSTSLVFTSFLLWPLINILSHEHFQANLKSQFVS